MEENKNTNDKTGKEEDKNINFVSFSEVDATGKMNEAYGYFIKSSMSEMFDQYEQDEQEQKKTR